MLTGITIFLGAFVIADIIVGDYQMRRLILLMLGAGMINIGQFIKSILIIKFERFPDFINRRGADSLCHVSVLGSVCSVEPLSTEALRC